MSASENSDIFLSSIDSWILLAAEFSLARALMLALLLAAFCNPGGVAELIT